MSTVPPGSDLCPLQRALQVYASDGLGDEELLQRFFAARDEAAFTALVRRHGPMVLGVCRRVLHHRQDAEDAFQATFLVLVRRAHSLRQPALLGNWLYGVAYRVAQAARRRASRSRARERQAARMSPVEPTPETAAQEAQALLDEELSRLPRLERTLLVHCDLEGRTHEVTARTLGIPSGSVSRRLAQARERLRQRLVRRGVALPAAALVAALGECQAAVVAAPLVAATVKARGCWLRWGRQPALWAPKY